MTARDLLANANISSGVRLGAMPPDEYVFVKEPPEIFCKTNSAKSPREMYARARLVVAAVSEYEPLLDLEETLRLLDQMCADGRLKLAGVTAAERAALTQLPRVFALLEELRSGT